MTACLNQKSQEIVQGSDLEIITERVDDVVLLIGQMMKMGLQGVLDKHIPKHWKQRKLSWGWTAIIWLAYILTTGDHRKVSMEEYVRETKETLSRLSDQEIEPLDFSDDRLGHLLKHLSKQKYWHKIEQDLNERCLEVYELPNDVVRFDATTVSGYHEVTEGGLFQFGHSKDDPNRPQIKVMLGSLDPMGMPLVTDVVSGERADDDLYIPAIDRVQESFNKDGLLFVGDCKMSALETRAHIEDCQHFYLSPLPLTGNTAQEMNEWITEGIRKDKNGTLELIFKQSDQNKEVLVVGGYEFLRPCCFEGNKKVEWTERVLVVNSPAHAEQQAAGLEKRLANAEQQITALTPPRGRGKRQITEETKLLDDVEKILKKQKIAGLLVIDYEKQIDIKTQYSGRGRGSVNREKQVIEKIRYQINRITRKEDKITELKERFGWKAFVTNSVKECLSFRSAILCYRNEYRVERIFNRLKSRLIIAPLFVQDDDQIQGITYLLTLGVRVLTLIEFVIRQSLQKDNIKLPGLHLENRKKMTGKPTAERILKAFSKISLTIVKNDAGHEMMLGMK